MGFDEILNRSTSDEWLGSEFSTPPVEVHTGRKKSRDRQEACTVRSILCSILVAGGTYYETIGIFNDDLPNGGDANGGGLIDIEIDDG